MGDRKLQRRPAGSGGSHRWLVRLLMFEGFLIAAVLFLMFLPGPWALVAILATGISDYMLVRILVPRS